jgi:hypothetical protein
LIRLKKSDVPISGSGQFEFNSFRIKPRKKLNLRRFGDPRVFCAWKGQARHQGIKTASLKSK